MFTSQSTLERRAAKEQRLAGIEERLTTVATDLDGLKHSRVSIEDRLMTAEKRTATMEAMVTDVSCSVTSRNDTLYQLTDSNRTLVRQVQDLNARIDDVLQRMIELKADIDKLTTAPTGSSSFKFGGGTTSSSATSKFALPAKKTGSTDTN